jgi:hypothetical protein
VSDWALEGALGLQKVGAGGCLYMPSVDHTGEAAAAPSLKKLPSLGELDILSGMVEPKAVTKMRQPKGRSRDGGLVSPSSNEASTVALSRSTYTFVEANVMNFCS